MKLTIFIIFVSLFFALTNLSVAQNTEPIKEGSMYTLNFKNILFKVDTAAGGKITSFQIDGNEFLVPKLNDADFLYGATLWPAPQSWPWPPPFTEIEDGTYTASVENNKLSLESVDEMDMKFIKSFWANESDTSININYCMVNTGSNQRRNALWELSRPPVNGLTFWPTGPGGTWGDLASSVVEQNNHSWLNIDAETRRNLKFFADGAKGWFAHVDANRNLYIKTFTDVNKADFAEGEGELELWIANDYIELESLSAAQTLNTNDTLHYNLKWYLRKLPESITAEIGSAELLALVNSTINNEETSIALSPESIDYCVYPNPAYQNIYFSWTLKNQESASINIYNTTGQLCIASTITKNNSLNITKLNSGIYFYTILLNNKLKSGRFIKE